jgi:hypothetical protein
MTNILKRFLRTRYVLLLEDELQRLRAENRALTNSLLGTAGFPPLDFPPAQQPVSLSRLRKRSWHQFQTRKEIEQTKSIEASKSSV